MDGSILGGSLLSAVSNEGAGDREIYLFPPWVVAVEGWAGSSGLRKALWMPTVGSHEIGVHWNGECQRDMGRAPTARQTLPPPNPFLKRRGRGWWQKGREEQRQRPSIGEEWCGLSTPLSFFPPSLSFSLPHWTLTELSQWGASR